MENLENGESERDSPSRADHAQVQDPGEYNQRRQLQEIADTQREARKTLKAATAGVSRYGGVPEEEAFADVRALALHLKWPVVNQGGAEYFNQHLGMWTVSPPPEMRQLLDNTRHSKVTVSEDGVSKTIERVWSGGDNCKPKRSDVVGLYPHESRTADETAYPFVKLPPSFSPSWELKVDYRHTGADTHEFKVEQVPVPLEITRNAFDLCNKFLDESGLLVRIEENKPHIKL
jgi:hypothetical protein